MVFANRQVACSTDAPGDDDDNTGAIVGGVVGGLAGVILLVFLNILLWLCCIKKRGENSTKASMECVYSAVWLYLKFINKIIITDWA